MSVLVCPSCRTQAPPGAIFCDNCGYDLRTLAPGSGEAAAPVFPAPQAGSDQIVCSSCQHVNIAGSAFCENCGMPLTQAPIPKTYAMPAEAMPPKPAAAAPAPAAPAEGTPLAITGRFVVQGSNTTIPIPAGKQAIVIGREDPVSGVFPDIDLDPYGGHEAGVGRRHAQLVFQGGYVHLEDLDSVNGTVLNRTRLAPRQPQPIKDGDEVRFGKLVMIYYTK